MLKIFNYLKDKFKLKKEEKEPIIKTKKERLTEEEILELYKIYKEKSIRENRYYIKGSNYMKRVIDSKISNDLMNDFFITHFDKIDKNPNVVPLELGNFLEALTEDPNFRLGMHKSDSVICSNVYMDKELNDIMTSGLVNNGSNMQGLVTTGIKAPNKTIANADDIISALAIIKSTYKGSKGTILVKLPKDVVDNQFEIIPPQEENAKKIYNYDSYGIPYLKPELIIGYVALENEEYKFYSREDLLNNKIQKKL